MSEPRTFSDTSFRLFLAENRLMGCCCDSCGMVFLPPRPICTNCFGRDLQWIEIPAAGRLAAFTCISVGPPAMLAEGYDRDKPYCSGVVEMDGGVRIDARIEGVDTKKPEDIRIGMPMRAVYLHREREGVPSTVLAFTPANPA